MKILYFTVVFALLSVCWCAPLAERVEDDPELTAGYFEGDIVLPDNQLNRNGLRNSTMRWPNNIVNYYINEDHFDAAHRDYVIRGMRIIEGLSCIRFQEVTPDHSNYVNITSLNGGCYSTVGWRNTVQTYNLQNYKLDSGCFRIYTVVHEFLHTLGFYHMQSASDRDDYVRIATENIQPDMIHNFNKYDEDVVDGYDQEYDYGSVMHYSAYAFSANGEQTIVPLKEAEAAGVMGQRLRISDSDVNRLNVMYRCPMGA